MKVKRKTGRPKLPPGHGRTETIHVQVKPSEKDLARSLSERAKRPLAEWVRNLILREAGLAG